MSISVGVKQRDEGLESSSKNGIGKVLKEDTLECFSRNQSLYRVIISDTELILQQLKHPDILERYSLHDLFGVQTYRSKKKKDDKSRLSLAAAYVCFTLYPRIKRGVITTSKFREKTQIVFQTQKAGFCFEENLEQASAWKDICLRVFQKNFSKWQLEKLATQSPTSIDSPDSEKQFREIYDIEMERNKFHGLSQEQPYGDWNPGGDEGKSNTNSGTHEIAISLSSQTLLMRKFLVILNPKSGQGKTLSIFKETVYPILCESGIKIVLLVTERSGHAYAMASAAYLSDIHGIVTVGGDGLLYEVVNGLRSRRDAHLFTDLPVGVIAGGSGNGLARSIASYSGETEDYLRNPVLETTLAVARGRVLPVNLLEVDVDSSKVYAFLSVGLGILADIDVESEVIRSFGESRFTLWSLLRLAKLRKYTVEVKYSMKSEKDSKAEDECVIRGDFVNVYACCQSHIGSDIHFAPKATANDGLIHLTIARGDIGRARLLQFLLGLEKGTHVDVPGVEYVRVKEFSIYSAGGISGTLTLDGEKVSGENVTARLASKPLNVFAL